MNSCVRCEDRDSLMKVLPFSSRAVVIEFVANPPQLLCYSDDVRCYKFNKSRGNLMAGLEKRNAQHVR